MYDYPKPKISFTTDEAYFLDLETKTNESRDVRHVQRYFCFRIGVHPLEYKFRDRFGDNIAYDMLNAAKSNRLRLSLRGYITPYRIGGAALCDLTKFGIYSEESDPDWYELRGEIWYQHYLDSDQWKQKRKAILQRDGECKKCGNTSSLVVHHLTYKRVGNEELADLIALCRRCHH